MNTTCYTLGRLAANVPPRADRVCLLIGVAASLSLADLWLTVHFMRTTGMVEINPLARLIAGAGPLGLALLKGASVVVHGVVLGVLRRRRSAEVAAWVSVAVLTILTVQWLSYVGATSDLGVCESQLLACQEHYVKLGE